MRASWASKAAADAKQVASANQTEWGTLRAQNHRGTFRPQLQNLLAIRVADCVLSLASYFSNVRTYLITVLI
jgi:hypothetical protein